jgi:hypothetical protein
MWNVWGIDPLVYRFGPQMTKTPGAALLAISIDLDHRL